MAFQLLFSANAERALTTAPAATRQTVRQLLNGLVELAAMYPLDAPLWTRLGRIEGTQVRVEIDDRELRLDVDPVKGLLRVIDLAPQGGEPRRRDTVRRPVRT